MSDSDPLRKLPPATRKHLFDKAYRRTGADPDVTVSDVACEALKEHYKFYDDTSLDRQLERLTRESQEALDGSCTLKDVLNYARRLTRLYAVERGTRTALDRLNKNIPNA
ncbi:MAG: hypothetical protein ACLFO2_01930, partial [Candidatus Woesearchaeota archaeon]